MIWTQGVSFSSIEYSFVSDAHRTSLPVRVVIYLRGRIRRTAPENIRNCRIEQKVLEILRSLFSAGHTIEVGHF